jgi:chaperonin cofactor prefoldin
MSKMQSPEAQARYEAFQDASNRMRDLVRKQEQLTSSKTECEMVAGELGQLKAEEPVYKLMGKMLILQDQADAKANVAQRLQMIDREMCVGPFGGGQGRGAGAPFSRAFSLPPSRSISRTLPTHPRTPAEKN